MHTVSAMFKNLVNEGCALIYNGVAHKFDITGAYVGQIPLTSKVLSGLSKVNVLSLLATKDCVAIGVAIGDTFKNFEVKGTTADKLLMFFSEQRQFMRVLRRSGSEGDIRYNQSLFVYLASVDVVSLLKKAMTALSCTMEVK